MTTQFEWFSALGDLSKELVENEAKYHAARAAHLEALHAYNRASKSVWPNGNPEFSYEDREKLRAKSDELESLEVAAEEVYLRSADLLTGRMFRLFHIQDPRRG